MLISLALTRRTLTAAATLSLAVGGVAVLATPANAACSDVEVIFARGSLEAAGTGLAGTPFVAAVKSDLSGLSVSSYAVNYAADAAQTSAGAGATDLVKHLTSTAASCSGTRFVLGGYSQGATVVDIALGIKTATGGTGSAIPAALSAQVAAIVTFGNPLGLQGSTIAKSSATYGARSKDYCASGDPVCGGGANVTAHFTYGGTPATDGAAFAAGLVKAGTVPTTPVPTTPVPTAPAPTTGPTAPAPTTPVPPAANAFQRGPDPTTASIEATTGPFAVSTTTVGSGNGFGGGTIYYPTDTTAGTFGGVVVAPGFTESQSRISWYGPRLASQGFVVFTIDTNSITDFPSARADQMLSALTYLTTKSTVASRVDANRLAVMGHSMGGGGTMEAANKNKALKAAIPLTGWDTTTSFPAITTPTLVIGAQNDTTAPVAQHSLPFYNGLTSAKEKAYLVLAGASHSAPTTSNVTIAKYSIAWLKRFVDDDTRYSQFICPGPSTGSLVSTYTNTCPV